MPDSRRYPRLEAFDRLQTRDGLPINAERWQQAHNYHRRRQNFYYQALFQPGIVYGLGVVPIPDQPDGRLLQIQPGVAIDFEGNPIIVKTPEEFRLDSDPGENQTLLVYLAVNYVDPDDLRHATGKEFVQETFRIVEKLQLGPQDVELCCIRLQAGVTTIQAPTNAFSPDLNQLDWRERAYPHLAPVCSIQVAHLLSESDQDSSLQTGLTALLRSLRGLYPSLGAVPTIPAITTRELNSQLQLECQLLCIPYAIWLQLSGLALERLQLYLAGGGTILLVVDFGAAELRDLLELSWELRAGLADARRDPDLWEQVGAQLEGEITANQRAIAQGLVDVEQQVAIAATRLGLSLTEPGELGADHPLRSTPFSFSQLPTCPDYPIFVKNWDGLVLMVGDLTYCWGYDPGREIPREVVRSAQEWGINLLHFAAQRWQWQQFEQFLLPSQVPTDSLQQRTQLS